MVFEVQGKTDNFVKLSKDTDPGIEFLSARKLVEYEIQMEALEFKSVNNISLGIVKFVFRRNMEFHVTNPNLEKPELRTLPNSSVSLLESVLVGSNPACGFRVRDFWRVRVVFIVPNQH